MNEKPKTVDLSRHEYRAESIKGEPFFSFGWPIGLAALLAIVGGTIAVQVFGMNAGIGAMVGGVIGYSIAHLHSELTEQPLDRHQRHAECRESDFADDRPEHGALPHQRLPASERE